MGLKINDDTKEVSNFMAEYLSVKKMQSEKVEIFFLRPDLNNNKQNMV